MKTDDVDVVYLVAPPLGGKGTQGKKLEDKGCTRIVMSEKLEERKALTGGAGLAPDEVAISVINEAVSNLQAGEWLVIDGAPRTVAQVDFVVRSAKDHGHRIKFVVIEVPDEVCEQRLPGRQETEGRSDDDVEVYKERRTGYRSRQPLIEKRIEEVAPLSLVRVSGVGTVTEVNQRIVKGIGV